MFSRTPYAAAVLALAPPSGVGLRILSACTIAAVLASTSFAQTPGWRVSAATSASGIRPAGFPSDVTGVASQQVAASGLMSLRLSTASEPATLWTQTAAAGLRPVARLASIGVLGPGRTGGEAGHEFQTVWNEDFSVAAPFNLFAATAGPPGQSNPSVGIWLNDGTNNRELVRGGTDGALGPNLGPNISLVSSTGNGNRALGRIQPLPGNAFALGAQLDTPEGRRDVVIRREFEGEFEACALAFSSDPTLAPGASGPEADQFRELNGLAQGAGGELYTFGRVSLLVVSPIRAGIWRVCQGSPATLAVTGDRGAWGPGYPGSPRAEFFSFSLAAGLTPLGQAALLFQSRVRLDGDSSASPLIDAIFLNDGNTNRPLVALGDSGTLGPGIAGHSFSGFTTFKGERVAALLADVRAAGSAQDRRGLWRLSPDGLAEPLALVGETGTLAPGQGDVWLGFDDALALANGDIVAVATSRPNGVNTRALWRFRPGRAPQRLFGPGDPVSYSDASGTVRLGTVDRIDQLVGSQLPAYAGDEGWINAEGDMVLQGRITGNALTLTFQSTSSLLDRSSVFVDGFEP